MDIGYYNLEDELDTFTTLISKEVRGMNIEGDEYVPRSEGEFSSLIGCLEGNTETFEQDIDSINEILEELDETEKEIFLEIVEEKNKILNLFSSVNHKLEELYNDKHMSEDKTFRTMSKEYVDSQKKLEVALENKKDLESEMNNLDTDNEDYDSQESELYSKIYEVDSEISDLEVNMKEQTSEYQSLVQGIETIISEYHETIKNELSEIEPHIYDIKEIKKNHFKNSCYLDTKNQNIFNLIDEFERNKKPIKINKP